MIVRTVYVFLSRRPQDSQSWPNVYHKRELADVAIYRTSDVVEVDLIEKDAVNVPQPKRVLPTEEDTRKLNITCTWPDCGKDTNQVTGDVCGEYCRD